MSDRILQLLIEVTKSGISSIKDAQLLPRSVSIFSALLVVTTVMEAYAPRSPRRPPRRPPTSLVEKAPEVAKATQMNLFLET
jgi:hypothetical protein